jgi:hypothetical protein
MYIKNMGVQSKTSTVAPFNMNGYNIYKLLLTTGFIVIDKFNL